MTYTGEKWITNIKDYVDVAIKRLKEHTKNSKDRLVTVAINSNNNSDNSIWF